MKQQTMKTDDTIRADLASLRAQLWAKAEQAYLDVIKIAQKEESLGFEAKINCGEFGQKNLDAHVAGSMKLGRHRALVEACAEIDKLLLKNDKRQL